MWIGLVCMKRKNKKWMKKKWNKKKNLCVNVYLYCDTSYIVHKIEYRCMRTIFIFNSVFSRMCVKLTKTSIQWLCECICGVEAKLEYNMQFSKSSVSCSTVTCLVRYFELNSSIYDTQYYTFILFYRFHWILRREKQNYYYFCCFSWVLLSFLVHCRHQIVFCFCVSCLYIACRNH